MKSTRNGCVALRPGSFLRTGIILALTAIITVGCGPNRGPEYGANEVESKALAIPPNLAAEPLAAQNPYPNLPDVSEFRPGPQPAEKEGEWAAKVDGNTLIAPVPEGWALGTVRAALLMQGVGIAEERKGVLRTAWLGSEALGQLGVPAPEEGHLRFTVKSGTPTDGGTRIIVQGTVRDGDAVRSANTASMKEFLLAVQPAFGKRR